MIFATDLDRTMIYSKAMIDTNSKDYICIERKPEMEISYITLESKRLIEEYKGLIVPVTTRSIEQYKRIDFFNKQCDWAITTNGGTILHNGEVYEPWEEIIKSKIANCDMNYAIEVAKDFEELKEPPKVVDNKFVYMVSLDVKRTAERFKTIQLDKNWTYTIQGRKVYIVPKEITKSSAILFLANELGIKKIITAGDGKLDVDMLEIGQIAFTPKHGEVYKEELYNGENLRVIGEGITASEDILKEVYKIHKGCE